MSKTLKTLEKSLKRAIVKTMDKKGKNSIQDTLLRILSGKKVLRHETLLERMEPFLSEKDSSEQKYSINRTLKKMIEDDIVVRHESSRSAFFSLTKRGKQKMRTTLFSSQQHLVPTVWDGYWRIVIVDIPDHKKKEQDALRYLLKKAQFIQIKNSLWISPYSLEHIMIEIRNDMGLHDEILIFVTNKLDTHTENILIQKFAEKAEKKED